MTHNLHRLTGLVAVATMTLQDAVRDEWEKQYKQQWNDNDSNQINILINEEIRAFFSKNPSPSRRERDRFNAYLNELRSKGSDTNTWDITHCSKVCNALCLDLKTKDKLRADSIKEIRNIRNKWAHSCTQTISDNDITTIRQKLLKTIGNMKLLTTGTLVNKLNQQFNQPDPEEVRRENETLRQENAGLRICKWLVGGLSAILAITAAIGTYVARSPQVRKAVSAALFGA